MLVFLHVIIALSSLVYAGYTFFAPSKSRIHISQALIALTLGSGTYLVVSTKADMLHACTMGLIYTAVVSFGIVAASRKLAAENNIDK